MISKYLTILPAVAALLLAAGCSNDDMDGVLADGPVTAQVTAAISNGQTVTRVSTDGDTPAFADGDVINVVASEAETNQYTLSGGTWSADTPYYFQDINTVYFRGWYATSTPTDNSISINTTSQETNDSGWNEWDILAAPEVTAYAASPTINFTGDNAFSHVMSQVTLTFKAGNGVSSLENLTGYTLTDLTTDASFSTLTCELTAGSTIGDITQDIEASGTEYTCPSVILVPQDVTDGKLSLEVTFNGLTYTADLTLPESATAMAAGTHYTFNVTLSNTGLTVSSAAIANWTAATGSGSATFGGYTYTTDENGIRSYTVYNEAGLLTWSEYTRNSTDDNHWSTNCTLGADIELTSSWTSVGNTSSSYFGTFDGDGYTITGLTISATGDYQGLIGRLGGGGEVKNLALADVSITSSGWSTGAVVGQNDHGTITNCYVTGIVTGTGADTGGVVGLNYRGSVTACSFTGTVSSTGNYTGGVVGVTYNNSVTACYFSGTVTGSSCVGGVVGYNQYSYVSACYSTGTVTGSSNVGGMVGTNRGGTVATCYYSSTTTDSYATYVDGTDVTWAAAATTMNEALSSGGYSWEYVENEDENEPLKLASTATE